MRIRAFGPLAAVALLAACQTSTQVATIAASPTGAALVQGVTNFSAPVQGIVAKINAGLAATEADKSMVCGAISWASVAFNAFSPAFGLDPGMIADAQAGEVAASALCSGPTTDIGSAVATVAGAYLKTAAKLQAGGVPVAAVAAVPGG